MMRTYILITIIALLSWIHVTANNVAVENVSYDNTTTEISFDLSWENSWRKDLSPATVPYNYDGVWIFVKVRECHIKNSGSPTGYYHAWLSTTASDHSVSNSGSNIMTVEAGITAIDGTNRGMGVFIYREENGGSGPISTSVVLKWDKTTQAGEMTEIDATAEYDVEVFAIEMVNVPQSDFYLGDGAATNCFYDLSVGTSTPYLVTSENSFSVSNTNNRAIDGTGGTGSVVNAAFPKGWDSFWMMKYEISQAQYAAFLNTIAPDQAQNRTNRDLYTITNLTYVMTDNGNIRWRNAICLDPQGDKRTDEFVMNLNDNSVYNEDSDGGGVACNFMSFRDLLAYLDWAALRPLTEFEYEKACRGSVTPINNENAWGNSAELAVTGILNSGQSDELAANSGTGLCNYGNVAGVRAPMRCGFAATASTNRASAGASFYGIMDLSGNLLEPYLSIYYNGSTGAAYSNDFSGETGDGELDSDGMQDVSGWPSHSGDNDFYRTIGKGGSWYWNQNYIQVSRRDETWYTATTDTRNQYCGGRGGR